MDSRDLGARRPHRPSGRGLLLAGILIAIGPGGRAAEGDGAAIRGLTGEIRDVEVAVPAGEVLKPLAETPRTADLDLKRMAQWAMNYLIRTPRRDLDYEPVFQCHPLRCPPVPEGQDPVVACDTDARMDWEWYYMREIAGTDAGREVEAAFHRRIRSYIAPDGKVWSHPGAFNEGDIRAKYGAKDRVIHIWGATKILQSLAEHHRRHKDAESKDLARKVMLALKGLATWDAQGRCWFACGMGALHGDGSVVPNGWNRQPAPIVGPLVTYWLATSDEDGLAFAKAYARGMLDGCQPDGLRFEADGRFSGHSHATMHAVWGVAQLGLVTGEARYTRLAEGAWNYMLSRGTGTGWFPAGPDSCDETCCVSDMISVAAVIARSGRPEYFDYAERYLRNYISNLQFIVTPEFEANYRKLNSGRGESAVRDGLEALRKFQGGIIGGSGLNDFENDLLGRVSGFEMFGCCAPEGMRAIHTAWTNTIDRLPASPLGPAGVYVNMGFSRASPWGEVVSFLPDAGRLTVKAGVRDTYFLRPPQWATRDRVRAFVGAKPVAVHWSGDYVRFEALPGDELTITYPLLEFTHTVGGLWKITAPSLRMTFRWRGNMVTSADPKPALTPLFLGKPRLLPPVPPLSEVDSRRNLRIAFGSSAFPDIRTGLGAIERFGATTVTSSPRTDSSRFRRPCVCSSSSSRVISLDDAVLAGRYSLHGGAWFRQRAERVVVGAEQVVALFGLMASGEGSRAASTRRGSSSSAGKDRSETFAAEADLTRHVSTSSVEDHAGGVLFIDGRRDPDAGRDGSKEGSSTSGQFQAPCEFSALRGILLVELAHPIGEVEEFLIHLGASPPPAHLRHVGPEVGLVARSPRARRKTCPTRIARGACRASWR